MSCWCAKCVSSINTRRGMKLLPIQLPPVSTMDRLPLQLPFSPTDLLWRYPLSFPPPSQPPPSSPLIDFKTHLPTSLATDPRVWNREDVNTFIKWCEREFDLPAFDMDMFQMNGKAVCLLTKTDLAERCPGAGDVLHNVLQMLVRDSQMHQRCLPNSPVTPTSRYPLSPHGPHPPTPNWSLLPPESPFHNSHLAHFMTQSNSVTLSPAPSVDSQQGSPQHVDAAAANYAHTVFGNSSGSNQSDSDEDYQETSQNNSVVTASPPNTPGLPSISLSLQPPRSPKEPQNQNVSTGAFRPVAREFFPADTPESNTNGRLLWDFLQQLLNDPAHRYTNFIAWKNRDTGVFKIVDPQGLAKLWGIQKNHLSMNYDKMSRALRYYYRVNILRKVQGERHCYQFLRNPTELKSIKNISLLRQQMSPTRPTLVNNNQQQQSQNQQQQNNFSTTTSSISVSIKSEPNVDVEDRNHSPDSSHNHHHQQQQQQQHHQHHHRSSNQQHEDEEMPTDLSMVTSNQSHDLKPTDLSAKMEKHRISMIVGESYCNNVLKSDLESK